MKISPLSILLAGTFLSSSAVAITLEPTLDDSAISYSESTSADYNFIVKEYDSKGNSVTKYYKINIDKDRLSDSSNIVWAELDGKPSVMDDVIEIKLPKNKSKYFRYTYNYNGPDYINNNITTPSLLTGSIYTIKGGAIDDINDNTDIYSDFVNNSVSHSNAHANGGAIYEGNNGANINIAGNFIGNHAEGIWKSYSSMRNAVGGGAIFKGNYDTWDSIIGNFVGNYVIATSDASSGSWVNSSHQGVGGAIYNWLGNIENITGDFVGNYVIATGPAQGGGGAIYNNYSASIGNISGDFIGNFVESENTAFGGAIYTGSEAGISRINNINGDFIGNYIKSTTLSKGGAISLDGASYDKNEKTKIIGNFIDNYAKTSNGIALGGAIYTKTNLSIISDNQTYIYTGNYTQDSRGIINNAIFVDNAQGNGRISIDFKILNNGYIVFNDEIDGGYFNNNTIVQNGYSYNINISGDVCPSCDVNTIRFNDLVNNVYDLSIIKTQMALGKSAVINVVNDYIAQSNPYLRLDLDAVNKKVGQLNIGGNIEGTTSVIVNVLKDKETTEENSIVFATAKNHNLSEEEAQKSFEVYRVVGSPYMWAQLSII